MTIVRKPAASLLPGETIVEFPFNDPEHKRHKLGDPVQWMVLALPVLTGGEWVVDCHDLTDRGSVCLSFERKATVVAELVDSRSLWIVSAGRADLLRLALSFAATAPAAFDRAVAEIESTPAAKETTR